MFTRLWTIWLELNRLVFNVGAVLKLDLLLLGITQLALWVKALDSSFSYGVGQLLLQFPYNIGINCVG